MKLIQLLNNLLLSIRDANFKATKDSFVVHTLLRQFSSNKASWL